MAIWRFVIYNVVNCEAINENVFIKDEILKYNGKMKITTK